MRIGTVIQARMGSSRLPGKVLLPLAGRPVIWHVVTRSRGSRLAGEVALATSTSGGDDALALWAGENAVPVFRGSEDDVLSRIVGAARAFGFDAVARVTADCPLMDPALIDLTVEKFLAVGVDVACNVVHRTFPRGLDVEVLTLQALERASAAGLTSFHREHVTPFFYEHPELFRILSVEDPAGLNRDDLRICLDTHEDYELLKALLEHLPAGSFSYRDVITVFERFPDLAGVNAGVPHLKRGGKT